MRLNCYRHWDGFKLLVDLFFFFKIIQLDFTFNTQPIFRIFEHTHTTYTSSAKHFVTRASIHWISFWIQLLLLQHWFGFYQLILFARAMHTSIYSVVITLIHRYIILSPNNRTQPKHWKILIFMWQKPSNPFENQLIDGIQNRFQLSGIIRLICDGYDGFYAVFVIFILRLDAHHLICLTNVRD